MVAIVAAQHVNQKPDIGLKNRQPHQVIAYASAASWIHPIRRSPLMRMEVVTIAHNISRTEKEVLAGAQRDRRLAEMVEKIKEAGSKREYDCIIGVSGGVDSTTVAYHVKRLGLRPLAVHLDNGWNSELAVDNIKKNARRSGD